MEAFSAVLRRLRKQSGLTQAQLADRLAIAKSTISMYEVGAREPDADTMREIAAVFGVDMNTLYGSPAAFALAEGGEAMQFSAAQSGDLALLFAAERQEEQQRLVAAYANADESIRIAIRKLLDL